MQHAPHISLGIKTQKSNLLDAQPLALCPDPLQKTTNFRLNKADIRWDSGPDILLANWMGLAPVNFSLLDLLQISFQRYKNMYRQGEASLQGRPGKFQH